MKVVFDFLLMELNLVLLMLEMAFGNVGNLDLKITTYTGVVYMPACALTEFTPDPASDQSTTIHYSFESGNYTTTPP